jgi:hypothetical protein
MTPASGSVAARRSTSSSLISRNALLRGFGGGISSRVLYLTVRPRFLVVLAVIPARLPSRDDPDLAVSFGEYNPDDFTVVFSERNRTPLAVITSRVLTRQNVATKYLRGFTKSYAVLALVGRVFGRIPLGVATKCSWRNIGA